MRPPAVGASSSRLCGSRRWPGPTATLVAEMALNLIGYTREKARERTGHDGRNIFGMDARFTPCVALPHRLWQHR